MQTIGPISLIIDGMAEDINVPMATFETTLWPSTNRGAKISRLAGGITTVLINDCMTRSVIVEGPNASYIAKLATTLETHRDSIDSVISGTSRFAKLKTIHTQQVANLLYIRFAFTTGDAAGHNMTTKAADAILTWLLEQYSELKYVSISGNICTDKKVSAINGILGRGKNVIAELTISREICEKQLRASPEALVNLHIKKNLIGGLLAGSLRSANAHFANILLALYLATGQDAANIIEGSQGITHCEVRDGSLYFSVNLPNLIVGSVGNGKHLDFVRENLLLLGCIAQRDSGINSQRLALIIAATVLCGELSLLAAQANPGELTRSHMIFERQNKKN
ncbi:MAG: hydroxymethylglutaryl-CoA reductase [Gammaproteobacteria bacterium]|nr:hydroxymethylglutaryl-CoA reductase [Gammaproteobacteria bacterium]